MSLPPDTIELRSVLGRISTLVRQAQALLDQASGDAPAVAMDARTAERVQKLGEVAHRHLDFIEKHGRMTVADSKAIRREMYGDKMRSTANLFGREFSGALFYRNVSYETPTRNDQEVRLTEEGMRIARLWRSLHSKDEA